MEEAKVQWRLSACGLQHDITLSFMKQGAIDFSFFRMYVTYWP